MKKRTIFNQAVMGVALAASMTTPSLAEATELVRTPEGSMCLVYETDARKNDMRGGNYIRIYDFDLDVVYDFDLDVVMMRQRGYNEMSIAAPSFSNVKKEKIEEMRGHLSLACKTKLGIK